MNLIDHQPFEVDDNLSSHTGLVQEVLLILAGHPSQLIEEDRLKDSISSYFHPAAIKSFKQFIQISKLYNQLNQYVRQLTRLDLKDRNPSLKSRPSVAISAFGSSLSIELSTYQNVLVDLEHRLLSHHPSLVPADVNQLPSPPLSAILAEVHEWSSIFQALWNLIKCLKEPPIRSNHPPILPNQWSSPDLIQLIYQHSLTGSLRLSEILTRLQASIEQVWIDGFRSFVLYGQSPVDRRQTQPDYQNVPLSLRPLDDLFFTHFPPASSSQRSHQPVKFYFREHGFPNLPVLHPIGKLKHTVRQICHALSILKYLIQPSNESSSHSKYSYSLDFNKISLPLDLQSQLCAALSSVDRLSHPEFRTAIKNVQEIFSSHLFSTYLTPEILSNTLRTLSDVFLLRHSTFATNLVEGFLRLRTSRLSVGRSDNPGSHSENRRRARRLLSLSDRELDLVLLKAGISTELGQESSDKQLNLEGFSFESLSSSSQSDNRKHDLEEVDVLAQNQRLIDHTFSKLLLNEDHPVLLTYSPRPGLSLFLTAEVCESYSNIHSCLFSFLITRQRIRDCWRELTRKERLRTRWVKQSEENKVSQIRFFKRVPFEGLRRMSWFIDLIINYFFLDVIDQSISLLFKQINNHDQLFQTGNNTGQQVKDDQPTSDRLNFFQNHQAFLRMVEIGLGLKNRKMEGLMKEILKTCFEFMSEIENWSFELVPSLLSSLDEGANERNSHAHSIGRIQDEREMRMIKLVEKFKEVLNQFIHELRQDDPHLVNSSIRRDQDHDSYLSSDDRLDPASFLLKGSMFRRKSLDSLLLKIDFNDWFSSSQLLP